MLNAMTIKRHTTGFYVRRINKAAQRVFSMGGSFDLTFLALTNDGLDGAIMLRETAVTEKTASELLASGRALRINVMNNARTLGVFVDP